MTTDHDPRELRAKAEYVLSQSRRGWHSPESVWLADSILATVRDDDGEEQPTVTTTRNGAMVRVCRKPSMVWVSIDTGGDCVALSFKTFTRGQFRDLCRGLGIEVTG